jgi:hypothetical protein
MRIAGRVEFRGEADQPEHRIRARSRFAAGMSADARAEGDRVSKRQARVERGIAVLEHHLHRALHLADRNAARAAHLLAVENQGTGIGLDQADQQPRRRRLAAAGLADDAQRFALADLEADRIDGLHDYAPAGLAAVEGEVFRESFRDQHRLPRPADVARIADRYDRRFGVCRDRQSHHALRPSHPSRYGSRRSSG